jgi:hypothetical protein
MQPCKHDQPLRQRSMMRRIVQSLAYLRGEATAAALDDVAVAIGHAERSVSLIFQKAPLPSAEQGATDGRAAIRKVQRAIVGADTGDST